MELLVRRLETLIDADVSREEVLRQLNRIRPNLKNGEVLRNAKRLLSGLTPPAEQVQAHEYLKDILPLEESYITSAGPLGTTSDEVTFWDHPKKPLPFVGLIVSVSLTLFGAIAYKLGAPVIIWWFLLFLSLPVGFIVSIMRAVLFNKWRARQRLNENILRNARFFESRLVSLGVDI